MSISSSNRTPILQMIFAKARRLAGSPDPFTLPDTPDPNNPYTMALSDYVNSFYLYDFPAQFRSLKLKDKYIFNTIAGIDTYAFDSEHYTTVEMPCYCAKRPIPLFQDPSSFYTSAFFGTNYNWQQQTNFAFGNNKVGPYSGVTTGSPLLRSVNNNPANTFSTTSSSIPYPVSRVQNNLITANVSNGVTLNVTDDGQGNLIGDCKTGGTINYATGQISNLVFTQAVPRGNPIQIQYISTVLNIPLAIMFFQNQFTLAPCPDQGYTIELIAYRQPSQALANTPAFAGTPELSEWWECIAMGAAKKIYQDRLDTDGEMMMETMLAKQYSLVMTRTYAQLGKQRMGTIFADQLSTNSNSGSGFFGTA